MSDPIKAAATAVNVVSSPGLHLPFGIEIPYAVLTATGMWSLVGGIILALIKLKPRMRELKIDSEEKLRDDMLARMQRMEETHAETIKRMEDSHAADKLIWAERLKTLEERLEHVREVYEGKLETKEALHQQEISRIRHKLGNIDSNYLALILMIENSMDAPQNIRDAARKARELREAQLLRESSEAATISSDRTANALDRVARMGDNV